MCDYDFLKKIFHFFKNIFSFFIKTFSFFMQIDSFFTFAREGRMRGEVLPPYLGTAPAMLNR